MEIKFKINKITCGACVKLSCMALKKIPGVKRAEVESNGSAIVESDKGITKEEILGALAKVDKTVTF